MHRLLGAFVVLMLTAMLAVFSRPPEPAAPTSTEKEVLATLTGWMNAWASQNSTQYLAYYSTDFELPESLSRHQWEQQRRQKIKDAGHIRLEAVDVVLEVGSPVAVVATFQQRYQSEQITEVSNKMLVFIRENETATTWKIAAERTSY